jgi:hypothetical protein
LPSFIAFAKLRAGWAQVGNDTDPYRLTNVYNYLPAFGNSQRGVYDRNVTYDNIVYLEGKKAMDEKAKIMAIFSERYDAWKVSQAAQTSGYEYERSFEEFMHQMGQELLQQSVGEESNSRKKKPTK